MIILEERKIMREIKVLLLKNPLSPGGMPLCSDTIRHPKEAVSDMQNLLSKDNIKITFEEREAEIPKNMAFLLTINNKTLEELVPLPDPSKYCGMSCSGCSGESGDNSGCSRIYTQVPESVLRLAIKKAAALIP